MSTLCIRQIPNNALITPPSHLDVNFFSNALKEGLRASKVKVHSVKFMWGSKPGESYSSEIYRAIINADICLDTEWTSLQTSLIVKFIPRKYENNVLELANVFLKEKITYYDVLPHLETLSDGDCYASKCFYTQNDPPTIVFQDLQSDGFTTYEYDNQLDFDHAVIVIQKLAKFHATSMVLLKKNPSLKARYQKGFCSEEVLIHDRAFSKILKKTLQKVISVCSSWPDFKHITEKLENFAKRFDEITPHLSMINSTDRFHVVNHGDVWTNNFMFNYHHNQQTEIKFVDFQFSFYGSPGCDLNMLFNTSIQLNVLENRDILIDIYYETFKQMLNYLRYENIPTKNDLIYEVRARELYGFFYMFSYLPIVRTFPKNLPNDSTLHTLNDEEKTRQLISMVYQNEDVIAQLKYSLRRFDELGVLDEY